MIRSPDHRGGPQEVWCSLAAPDRVALPEEVHSGAVWVPALGRCTVEPLPGGWLLRPCDPADGDRPAGLVLDLTGPARRCR